MGLDACLHPSFRRGVRSPFEVGRLASPPSGAVGAGSLPSRAGGFGESPRTLRQRVPGRLVHHGPLATLCGDAFGRSEQRCDGPVRQSKVMGEDLGGGTSVLQPVVNRTGLMRATPSHTFDCARFEPEAVICTAHFIGLLQRCRAIQTSHTHYDGRCKIAHTDFAPSLADQEDDPCRRADVWARGIR